MLLQEFEQQKKDIQIAVSENIKSIAQISMDRNYIIVHPDFQTCDDLSKDFIITHLLFYKQSGGSQMFCEADELAFDYFMKKGVSLKDIYRVFMFLVNHCITLSPSKSVIGISNKRNENILAKYDIESPLKLKANP